MTIKEFIGEFRSNHTFKKEFTADVMRRASNFQEENLKSHKEDMSKFEDGLLLSGFGEKIYAVCKEIKLP